MQPTGSAHPAPQAGRRREGEKGAHSESGVLPHCPPPSLGLLCIHGSPGSLGLPQDSGAQPRGRPGSTQSSPSEKVAAGAGSVLDTAWVQSPLVFSVRSDIH